MDTPNTTTTNPNIPLAERMRPQTLAQVVGQQHLIGPGSVIRRMVENGHIFSMIFWGPPGVGKTTLAMVIAQNLGKPFFTLSATSAGVKDVREVIEQASKLQGAILFIDEIHRFNKGQQDALLKAVELGQVTLIGATTENPSFEVNSALLSRCRVFTLKSLTNDELVSLVKTALQQDAYLASKGIELKETAALLSLSGGDARSILNLLEMVADTVDAASPVITDELVMATAQTKTVLYDKAGEQHYDIISAFIKSMRGSDPNAALYYMARMIEGGEDPKFIARRMLILASEDIGNANPTAMIMATSCFQAVTFIGYPECELILSQTVIYLATSPKSNASYLAIGAAKQTVRETGNLPVPMHLRNAPTRFMKNQGYGKGYQYAHDYPGNFVQQEFLPKEISGKTFYNPGQNAKEEELRKRLSLLWKDKYKY